ncbi:hypothetical protein FQA39_LY01058 [Lamprigera yunnana]|nr:hypothetical protein FQA39_LY01058 [Lamprigera yunnana]
MPISEDEYDSRPSFDASPSMSKAELRKTHKPIMEKRRRARINHCLNEIKTLILDAMKKDPARHSKLEKADILEMAVKHLQNVQRQQLALAMATDPSVLRKFKAGFNECAEEVNRYISNLEGLDVNLQQRISTHLSKCISGIEQIVHLNFPGFGGVPFLASTSSFFTSPPNNEHTDSSGDQNNNPSVQVPQSLQVIPSRLPTGEFALLVPNSINLPYFPNVSSSSQGTSHDHSKETPRSSAFVTVVPSSFNTEPPKTKSPSKTPLKLLSPPQSPTSSSSTIPSEDDQVASSPRGFRPVQPSRIHSTLYQQRGATEPHSFVTSTSTSDSTIQTEVKTIRFPIQKFASPQKLAEPLSIITNQNERYKHAHTLNETSHFEENIQRGVKREHEFSHSGLLAVASPSNKIMKTYHESTIADLRVNKFADTVRSSPEHIGFHPRLTISDSTTSLADTESEAYRSTQAASTSSGPERQPDSQTNSDMWRPW